LYANGPIFPLLSFCPPLVLEGFWYFYHESATCRNEQNRVPYYYLNARLTDDDFDNHNFVVRVTPAKIQYFTQKVAKFKLPKINTPTIGSIKLTAVNIVKVRLLFEYYT